MYGPHARACLTARAVVTAAVLIGSVTLVSGRAPRPEGRAAILVLVSDGSARYKAALSGVRDALEDHLPNSAVSVVRLTGAPGETRQLVAAGPDVIVTLGTPATRDAVAATSEIPIVAGMVLTPHEIDGVRNATGVYLEHAIETDLAWLSQLLPARRRVGILYSAAGAARVLATERAASRTRLTIRAVRVNSANEIPLALASLAKDVDVILGLADSLVFNAETARAILTFSFRERIPVVGPSAGWVRAGAIYALHPDYGDIGRQTAKLALRVLDGQRASSLPPVRPRRVSYSINLRTAGELRINVPDILVRSADEVVR